MGGHKHLTQTDPDESGVLLLWLPVYHVTVCSLAMTSPSTGWRRDLIQTANKAANPQMVPYIHWEILSGVCVQQQNI